MVLVDNWKAPPAKCLYQRSFQAFSLSLSLSLSVKQKKFKATGNIYCQLFSIHSVFSTDPPKFTGGFSLCRLNRTVILPTLSLSLSLSLSPTGDRNNLLKGSLFSFDRVKRNTKLLLPIETQFKQEAAASSYIKIKPVTWILAAGGGTGWGISCQRQTRNEWSRPVCETCRWKRRFRKGIRVGFVRSSLFGLSSVNGDDSVETVTLSLRELGI